MQIGNGAVIGARSVITRDVPPYAVTGGAPARIVRYRFAPEIIDELLDLQWWHYGLSALEGVGFTNIETEIWKIRENVTLGFRSQYYYCDGKRQLESDHDCAEVWGDQRL